MSAGRRIGPRMRDVVFYVGERRVDAARAVGPHGSLRYGYATVARAVRAGIVSLRYVTERGRRVAVIAPPYPPPNAVDRTLARMLAEDFILDMSRDTIPAPAGEVLS